MSNVTSECSCVCGYCYEAREIPAHAKLHCKIKGNGCNVKK